MFIEHLQLVAKNFFTEYLHRLCTRQKITSGTDVDNKIREVADFVAAPNADNMFVSLYELHHPSLQTCIDEFRRREHNRDRLDNASTSATLCPCPPRALIKLARAIVRFERDEFHISCRTIVAQAWQHVITPALQERVREEQRLSKCGRVRRGAGRLGVVHYERSDAPATTKIDGLIVRILPDSHNSQ
ncbi:hypothetical protein LTS02_016648 [Friedmanniomyces endolithicus]|nr:hypothetical protein LTS02_016648 [Friedmanniomyces endolithicus]